MKFASISSVYTYTVILLCLTLTIFGHALATQHDVGSGESDWWIGYPAFNDDAGATLNHPSWILQALVQGPVLIYGHVPCPYCPIQEGYIKSALDSNGQGVQYFDIRGDMDPRGIDISIYDPNGKSQTVPLTVFITLVRDSEDQLQVGWHSAETLTSQEWVDSYLQEAKDQYQENSEEWIDSH